MKSFVAIVTVGLVVVFALQVEAVPGLVAESKLKGKAEGEEGTKATCCCCCGVCLGCSRDASAATSYNPQLKDIFSGYFVSVVPESEVKDRAGVCCCCCGWCLSCNRSE